MPPPKEGLKKRKHVNNPKIKVNPKPQAESDDNSIEDSLVHVSWF